MAVIEFRHVRKVYLQGPRQVVALEDLSLAVESGEFLVIMGPSGSGKSTLLHLAGALDLPTAGEVLLEGRSTSALSDTELTLLRRRRVGFVFQFFNLLAPLTVEENVALPLLLDGRRLPEVRGEVRPLLEAVGLGRRLDHRPAELSGGELQRAAIARALVTRPAILLADEPTGNLDSRTGREVLTLLKHLTREQDRAATVVMVTHNPEAAAFGERRLELRDGRLAG